ncbi:MAG: RNA 2',3'-cyclic phosphodiesterase [Rhodocyclales bacterium]|nr:RNA 2',3'-cyclic phosphodiesterase [Rhodocyclales bacterium]
MDAPHSHRVFFALWPDDEAVSQLTALGHALAAKGGRATRPAALHLTLAFIGSVSAAQLEMLRALATGVHSDAFELSLDRLGFWPQRGILWAGCRQPPTGLRRLSDGLVTALAGAGFAPDRHGGAGRVPHVTLARQVRCRELPRLETPIAWRVTEFVLVESHLHPSAASYRALAGFSLADAGAA